MASSNFPSNVTGVTVQTATNGALSGDGTSGNKLAVAVDGATVTVNGSDQLAIDLAGVANTQVLYDSHGVIAGDASFTFGAFSQVTMDNALLSSGGLTFGSQSNAYFQKQNAAALQLASFDTVERNVFAISIDATDANNELDIGDGQGHAYPIFLYAAPLAVTGDTSITGSCTAADIIPAATAYASLPTPGAGTYPIAVVNNSTVTSGTVSAGGGMHVNVIVWTGTLWTVLKNLT